jgi:hypothetical protein
MARRKNPDLRRVGQAVVTSWRESGLPRTLLALEKIADEYAIAYRLPKGDVYEAAEAAWRSKMERPNPGHIPGSVVEVRYRRAPGKYYQHTFKPGVHQRNNANGSVTLYHPSRRIWADDREPGFWKQYGDHNPRRGGRMAKSTPWLTYGLVGLAIYLIMKQQPGGAGVATLTVPGGGSTITAPDILTGVTGL